METKFLHFSSRLIRRPALHRHAVCGNHHSRPVIAITAMDEYFLVRILLQQLEKLCEHTVPRKVAMPGNSDELHSGFGDIPLFCVSSAQSQIYHDVDAHFFQVLVAGPLRLAASIELRSHFTKI